MFGLSYVTIDRIVTEWADSIQPFIQISLMAAKNQLNSQALNPIQMDEKMATKINKNQRLKNIQQQNLYLWILRHARHCFNSLL